MIMHNLEKYDFKRLESYIARFNEFKLGLNNEIYNEKKADVVRNIVCGFEQTYEKCNGTGKQIIQLTWLDPKETDEVICKVLDIPQRRLVRMRRQLLINFAEEMAYT